MTTLNTRYPQLLSHVSGDLFQLLERLDTTPCIREEDVRCSCDAGQDMLCRGIWPHNVPFDVHFPWLTAPETSRFRNMTDASHLFQTMDHALRVAGAFVLVQFRGGKLVNFAPVTLVHPFNEAFHHWRFEGKKLFSETMDQTFASMIRKENEAFGASPNMMSQNIRLRRHLQQVRINGGMIRYDANFDWPHQDAHHTLMNDLVNVPDTDVLLNRKDFPLLRLDGTNHPYEDTFGPNWPCPHPEQTTAILSGSCDPLRHGDVMIPTHDDIERASFQDRNVPLGPREWPVISPPTKDRVNWAVFRGSLTGMGTTIADNDRMFLFDFSLRHPELVDAKCVKTNARPRSHVSDPFHLKIPTVQKEWMGKSMTLQEQSDRHKMIVSAQGHVAAYRLSYELSSFAVIILLESPHKLWYSHMLEDGVHYISATRETLAEKIRWCQKNETLCQAIVQRAHDFYTTHLCWSAISDALKMMLIETRPGDDIHFDPVPDESSTIVDQEPPVKQLTTHDCYSTIIAHMPDTFVHKIPLARTFACLETHKRIWQHASQEGWKRDFTFFEASDPKLQGWVYNQWFAYAFKAWQTDHELAVGLMVNRLCRLVPNFVYTCGKKDGWIVMECLKTKWTLMKWLASPDATVDKLAHLLLQLAAALAVGQHAIGLIHGDCTPNNVMVQIIKSAKTFDYPLGEKVLSITTQQVPVLIDFDASTCVAFDQTMRKNVLLTPKRSTRVPDQARDVVQLMMYTFQKTNKVNEAMTRDPKFSALRRHCLQWCCMAMGEQHFDLSKPHHVEALLMRKTPQFFERRNLSLCPLSFVEWLFGSEFCDRSRVVVKDTLHLQMLSGLPTDILFWQAHLGPDNARAVAERFLDKVLKTSVPVENVSWLMQWWRALAKDPFERELAFLQPFPDLAQLYEEKNAWIHPNPQDLYDIEKQPAITLPKGQVWDRFAKHMSTANPFVDDWCMGLHLFSLAKFMFPDIVARTRKTLEEWQKNVWSANLFSAMHIIARRNLEIKK